jgi:hypothetical protein
MTAALIQSQSCACCGRDLPLTDENFEFLPMARRWVPVLRPSKPPGRKLKKGVHRKVCRACHEEARPKTRVEKMRAWRAAHAQRRLILADVKICVDSMPTSRAYACLDCKNDESET